MTRLMLMIDGLIGWLFGRYMDGWTVGRLLVDGWTLKDGCIYE